ncbi:Rossmann fold domain-containing protein [Erythrobacter sp.]|uniref:Rossmann fold domain-containing protein n=1 Tax=Erythrobacter sp. TaxID=1042 RepID=UPI002EAF7492|nr:hypothetical protein [Erythrobacter sp.]
MQVVLTVETLPAEPIAASAAFHADHLAAAERMLAGDGVEAIAICLPAADTDHDDWRLALARDLARRWTPRRVNVVGGAVGGAAGDAREDALAYLADAPGITGQYIPLS